MRSDFRAFHAASGIVTLTAVLAGAAGAATAAQVKHIAQTDQLVVKYREGTSGAQAQDEQTLAALHAVAARAGLHLRFVRRGWSNAMVLKLDRSVPDEAIHALGGRGRLSPRRARQPASGQGAEPFEEWIRILHRVLPSGHRQRSQPRGRGGGGCRQQQRLQS